MPIVIRHNGALNDITEGLAKGIQAGTDLAAQQAAIEEAKKRRLLEQRRLDMAQAQQDFENKITTSDQAYKETVRGQQQEDRTRIAGERTAAQAGNAAALGRVQQGAPERLGLGPAMARGAAQGGVLGAGLSGAMFTAQDQAAMQEAQQVARHMDPERGDQYVKDEENRIRRERADQVRPKVLKAWQDTLKRAQTADPNDPASAILTDPKLVGRAQTAIAALQAGADPEPFAQQFGLVAQETQQRRNELRTNTGFARQIEGRIASAQAEADGTLDEERAAELNDRIAEAQSYLDTINDPQIEAVDARGAYTKAMAALHGRGTTSRASKQQRSLYSESRKMAREDVDLYLKTPRGALLTPEQIDAMIEQRSAQHLQALKDEAVAQGGSQARAPANAALGGLPPGGPTALAPDQQPAEAPAAQAAPQAPVIPGTPEEAAGAEPQIRVQAVARAQQQLVRAKAVLDQQPDGPEKDAALARLKAEAAKWLQVQGNDPNAPAPGAEAPAEAPKSPAKPQRSGALGSGDAGMLEPGNIDVSKLPVVKNPDGSVSTVRSISIGVDGKEYLIPTIINGRQVSKDEAISEFRRTGKHLGVFKDPASADAYAEAHHAEMGPQTQPSEPSIFNPTTSPEREAQKARRAAKEKAAEDESARQAAAQKEKETPTPEELAEMRRLWSDTTPAGIRKANAYVGAWLERRGLDWSVIKRLRAREGT